MEIKPWHISLIGVLIQLTMNISAITANPGVEGLGGLGITISIFFVVFLIIFAVLPMHSKDINIRKIGVIANILIGVGLLILLHTSFNVGVLFIIAGIWQLGMKDSEKPISLSDAINKTKK